MLGVMELDRLFVDLDSVRWADVEHAYGGAEDLPGLLRALAGGADQASEALDELWGTIVHHETVFAASAAAVPFLARLAAAGIRPVELLTLLGALAAGAEEPGAGEPGGCRAAVAGQLPLILPLTGAADERVRRAAVRAAGSTGDPAARSVLSARRAEEKDAGVRAELLAALAALDPAGAAPAAAGALADGEPAEVRLVALMICAENGVPWTAEHREALLSLLPAGPLVRGGADPARDEPLRHIVDSLLARDTDADREAACALIESALLLPAPEARAEALWAAEHACLVSRGAPARLAPAVVPLLSDASFGRKEALLPVLELLGGHAEAAAPALAAFVAADGDSADRALEVLARLDPCQAARLLARRLRARSPLSGAGTAALAGPGGTGCWPAGSLPYDPELLNALRIELDALAEAADPGAGAPERFTALLESWGPRASAALPELTVLCERSPALFAAALSAVCPPESRARTADLLRPAAGAGPVRDRFAAADALYTLTGETGPLVGALAEGLRSGPAAGGEDGAAAEPARRAAQRRRSGLVARPSGGPIGFRTAAAVPAGPGATGEPVPELPREAVLAKAAALGPAALPLVPQVRGVLGAAGGPQSPAGHADRIRAAVTLWRLTGDATEPLTVLAGILAEAADGPVHRPEAVRDCVRAVARLGPAARSLAPGLVALLDHPEQVPAAVFALAAVGAAPPGAAALVLDCAERDTDPVSCLDALETLGPGTLTPQEADRLELLAERDRRVRVPGPSPRLGVRSDQRIRIRARALLAGRTDGT
ncbi:HEAT repeat domain-containing protein [Streptomyces sp. NPDC094448]|uniref:HEAT repeat domain-containing protein n=1 Tax=Streptomyces sp. NPDC094448 TaxID=3366063 RepID=UPI0037F2A903